VSFKVSFETASGYRWLQFTQMMLIFELMTFAWIHGTRVGHSSFLIANHLLAFASKMDDSTFFLLLRFLAPSTSYLNSAFDASLLGTVILLSTSWVKVSSLLLLMHVYMFFILFQANNALL